MSDQFSYKTPDTFERVQKIFEERDGEYRKMEEMNRVREEKIKKQENNLKEKEQQIRSREETVGQQENKLEERQQILAAKEKDIADKEKELQKQRLQLEADGQQSLLDASILREEVRNEKLKYQRLSLEVEEKLASMGYSAENIPVDPYIVEEKERKIKELEERLKILLDEIEEWEKKEERWEIRERDLAVQVEKLSQEKIHLWKKLMGISDTEEPSSVEQTEHSVATQKKEELDIVQDFEEEQSVIPTEGSEEKKESEGEEKKDKSEEPLTAEVFYQYLQTQDIEGSVMLRHAQDGDMVTIMSPEIEVTAVFAIKEPWFDIKKKIEVTHKIRRLIRNWNNSQNELTFSYDSVDHTVTGTGDFTTDKTAEELFNYLDGLLDKYFDPGEKK